MGIPDIKKAARARPQLLSEDTITIGGDAGIVGSSPSPSSVV